jgi:hypothetical protein
LDSQHRRVAELFDQVSDPAADRPAVLHNLIRELAAHVAAERSAVEPVVKSRSIGGDGLAQDLVRDYEMIETLLTRIERRKFNSPDVPDLVTELKDVTDAHIARSASELLPGLDSSLSAEESSDLAEKVSHADSMVMTHPHPHLLSLGPISAKLTALLSRFDRLRDRTVTNQPPSSEDGDPSMGGAT